MKLIKNLLVALVLFSAAGRLDASSVIEVSFDQLSRASDTVISGEVVSIVADRDPNGYIYSTVTIRVSAFALRRVKGSSIRRLILNLPGKLNRIGSVLGIIESSAPEVSKLQW